MPTRLLLAIGLLLSLPLSSTPQSAAPQTDLDAFMARVLARRDDNWKKQQQYVLEERERFHVEAAGTRLYGLSRDYSWFLRDGIFVRSPVKADGVTLSDDERRREEAQWMRREQRRAERRAARGLEELEPRFVSSAYFLEFRFDPGQYALAGREALDGRDVLRIEYYPTKMFREGRTRPNRELRERDAAIAEKMNKVSLVTLWIDPAAHQILKYEFRNIDMDFLPGRSLVRLDHWQASMRMGEPFRGVWLPQAIGITFEGATALGNVSGRYDTEYYDYRLADVTVKVR
jgi:hypothetical protein